MGCLFSKEDEFESRLNRPTTTYNRDVTYGYGITTPNSGTTYSYSIPTYRNQQQNVFTQRQQPKTPSQPKPKLGEYKCVCGRFWKSRCCWPDKYQNCKKCKRQVYPHSYRELPPSDNVDDDDKQPHEKELCQMCQQLGYSCTTKNTRRYTKKSY